MAVPTAARIARSVAAALLVPVVAVLTGCSTVLTGQALPDPAVLATPLTPTGQPAAWTRVVDPATGVRTSLPGQVTRASGVGPGGRPRTVHRPVEMPAGTGDVGLQLDLKWSAGAIDLAEVAADGAAEIGGVVTESQPVRVQGHPGMDVRVEYDDRADGPRVTRYRMVDAGSHLVTVAVEGPRDREAVMGRLIERMAADLQLPVTGT